MLSVGDLERALTAIGATAPARLEEVTGSTNSVAMDLAGAGAPSGPWSRRIIRPLAEVASAGPGPTTRAMRCSSRSSCGRRSRSVSPGWSHSRRAPRWRPRPRHCPGLPVRCKWPNDLLIDGGKLAGGILVESVSDGAKLRHLVVGIGVNLEKPIDLPGGQGRRDGRRRSSSVSWSRSRRGIAIPQMRFASSALDAWRERSATLGHLVKVGRPDGSTVRGTATDVDETGALLVRTAERIETIASGDVMHLSG